MKLEEIRKELDTIDRQIAELFMERLETAGLAGDEKTREGLPVQNKAEEERRLAIAAGLAKDSFEEQTISELFRQMIAISRKYQYRRRGEKENFGFTLVDSIATEGRTVVFQGVEGAYSQAAMLSYFGERVNSFHVPSFQLAMEAAANGDADYAVLPIENSSAGQVGDVYDLLIRKEIAIVGEVYLPVHHCLLGLPGTDLSQISVVYSHPQGLMQCQRFLNTHPAWQQISQANTAMAARKVVEENDPSHAAIASALAGKLCGLEVLKEAVNDNLHNTTRFVIVSGKREYTRQAGKISICFEIPHESGSLYNTLSHIIYNNLNMNKIESRPIPDRPFEYRFFVDFEGNLSDPAVTNALLGIRSESGRVTVLGNY